MTTHPHLFSSGGIVILARMDSRRFPKKALHPLLGKPLLAWCIERLSSLSLPLVLATSTRSLDDPLVALATSLSVPSFRGHPHNVLSRLIQTLTHFEWSYLVRISGDSPFIDPQLVSQALALIPSKPTPLPYIITNLYPSRLYPPGFSVEVIPKSTLLTIAHHTKDASHLEHVSSFAYQNPHLFTLITLSLPTTGAPPTTEPPPSHLSFTVDHPQDIEKLSLIASQIENPLTASYQDVINKALALEQAIIKATKT